MKNKQQAEKEVLDIIAYGNVKHSISIEDEKKAEKEVLDIITYGNIKYPVSIENEEQAEKEILNILARGNETEIKHFTSTEEKQQAEKEVLDIIARGNIKRPVSIKDEQQTEKEILDIIAYGNVKRPISVEDKQKAEKEVLDILARGNETEIKHLLTDEVRSKFDYLIKDNLPKESIDIQEAIQKEIDDNVVTAKEQEIIKHYSAVVREDVSHRRDSQRRYERDFAQHLTVTQVKGIIKNQEFGIKKAFLNELKDFDKEAKNEIMSEMKSYTKAILNAKTEEEKEKIAEDTYKKLHGTIEKHPTQKITNRINESAKALEGSGMPAQKAQETAKDAVNIASTASSILTITAGSGKQQPVDGVVQNPNLSLENKTISKTNEASERFSLEQFEKFDKETRRVFLQSVVLDLMQKPDSVKEWANKKVLSDFIARHPEEFKELIEGNSKESKIMREIVKNNSQLYNTEGKDPDKAIRDFGQVMQKEATKANNINPEEKNKEEESKQDMLPKGSGGDNLAKMDNKALSRIEGEEDALVNAGPEIQKKSTISM